jgi:hypothetical protein
MLLPVKGLREVIGHVIVRMYVRVFEYIAGVEFSIIIEANVDMLVRAFMIPLRALVVTVDW